MSTERLAGYLLRQPDEAGAAYLFCLLMAIPFRDDEQRRQGHVQNPLELWGGQSVAFASLTNVMSFPTGLHTLMC